MDSSTPGFPVLHYLQEPAQTHVQWGSDAIQPSHALSTPFPPAFIFASIGVLNHYELNWKSLSRVRLSMTLWTVARQAPLSVEFSRQEYWSGLPFPSAGDLPHPGMEPGSPTLQADFTVWATREALIWDFLNLDLMSEINWNTNIRYCSIPKNV